jgi:hypothetical protein
MINEIIQGNEWVAYGVLDTYSHDETWDRLQPERVRHVAHCDIPDAIRRNLERYS